jgi:hypothetical protein
MKTPDPVRPARTILRDGFECPRVTLEDMNRNLCTLPEPTVTGSPREGRGRATAALISVCLDNWPESAT